MLFLYFLTWCERGCGKKDISLQQKYFFSTYRSSPEKNCLFYYPTKNYWCGLYVQKLWMCPRVKSAEKTFWWKFTVCNRIFIIKFDPCCNNLILLATFSAVKMKKCDCYGKQLLIQWPQLTWDFVRNKKKVVHCKRFFAYDSTNFINR